MERSHEAFGRQVPPPPEALGFAIDAPQVQIALALRAYREAHPEAVVGAQRADTPVDLRAAAMTEWISETHGARSLAARYRDFAEQKPHVRVNLDDGESLGDLLAELAGTLPEA